MTLNRDTALARLREHIKNEKTIVHCLASEAVMRALARTLGRGSRSLGPDWPVARY